MPVNVKLLKKVRKLIAEEPKRLNMGLWGSQLRRGRSRPPCGTVACLAGWTILASRPISTWRSLFRHRGLIDGSNSAFAANHGFNPDRKAARLLGIHIETCPFYNTSWGKREVLAWIDRQIDAAQKV